MDKLKAIVETIPDCLFQGLSLSLVCLAIGGAVAIARSSDVEFSKESIKIQGQATKNQTELENARELIDAYQNSLQTVEKKVRQIGKQDRRAREIVEDIQLVEKVVPKSKVERIDRTIKESKEVLKNELTGYGFDFETD